MSRPAESTPIPAHARAYTLLRSAPKPEPAGSCSVSRPQVRRRCIQLQAPAAGHPYSPQTADGRARLDALIARTGVAASPPRGQRSGAPYLHVRVPDEAGGGGFQRVHRHRLRRLIRHSLSSKPRATSPSRTGRHHRLRQVPLALASARTDYLTEYLGLRATQQPAQHTTPLRVPAP